MKNLIILSTVFLTLSFFGNSYAKNIEILKSIKFERNQGKPVEKESYFPGLKKEAKIIIQNGGDSKKSKVSAASIKVNNEKIFKTKDFNKKINKIEKNIYIKESNILQIKLYGTPKSFIKISIIQDIPQKKYDDIMQKVTIYEVANQLKENDISSAMNYFYPNIKDKYDSLFHKMDGDTLKQISNYLINSIKLRQTKNIAVYKTEIKTYDNKTETSTFEMYFYENQWKIIGL